MKLNLKRRSPEYDTVQQELNHNHVAVDGAPAKVVDVKIDLSPLNLAPAEQDVQDAILDFVNNSPQKVPYTEDGIEMVKAAVQNSRATVNPVTGIDHVQEIEHLRLTTPYCADDVLGAFRQLAYRADFVTKVLDNAARYGTNIQAEIRRLLNHSAVAYDVVNKWKADYADGVGLKSKPYQGEHQYSVEELREAAKKGIDIYNRCPKSESMGPPG